MRRMQNNCLPFIIGRANKRFLAKKTSQVIVGGKKLPPGRNIDRKAAVLEDVRLLQKRKLHPIGREGQTETRRTSWH